MTGIVLDAVLMLLLVAALGYGVRLERKLTALRAGQLAFAGAVTELNQAAGRAEAALASLRDASQETDMLHDRIVKAREVRQQLEGLMVRAPVREAAPTPAPAPVAVASVAPAPVVDDETADRARRMASLLERIGGAAEQAPRENVERLAPVLQALAANQAAQQSLNRARRSLDTDLFAA